jgi:hypothetical protein
MQPSDRNIHKLFFIETFVHTNTSSKETTIFYIMKTSHNLNNAMHANDSLIFLCDAYLLFLIWGLPLSSLWGLPSLFIMELTPEFIMRLILSFHYGAYPWVHYDAYPLLSLWGLPQVHYAHALCFTIQTL